MRLLPPVMAVDAAVMRTLPSLRSQACTFMLVHQTLEIANINVILLSSPPPSPAQSSSDASDFLICNQKCKFSCNHLPIQSRETLPLEQPQLCGFPCRIVGGNVAAVLHRLIRIGQCPSQPYRQHSVGYRCQLRPLRCEIVSIK